MKRPQNLINRVVESLEGKVKANPVKGEVTVDVLFLRILFDAYKDALEEIMEDLRFELS